MLMDGSYEGSSSIIYAWSVNAPMRNRGEIGVIAAVSVNALTDTAEITPCGIERQSGDDVGSFLRMIRPSA